MTSLVSNCPNCTSQNHVAAYYCNFCGERLRPDPSTLQVINRTDQKLEKAIQTKGLSHNSVMLILAAVVFFCFWSTRHQSAFEAADQKSKPSQTAIPQSEQSGNDGEYSADSSSQSDVDEVADTAEENKEEQIEENALNDDELYSDTDVIAEAEPEAESGRGVHHKDERKFKTIDRPAAEPVPSIAGDKSERQPDPASTTDALPSYYKKSLERQERAVRQVREVETATPSTGWSAYSTPAPILPTVPTYGSVPYANDVFVQGHFTRDGIYVPPHHRTAPDNTTLNNYGTRGNINPYTGQVGTHNPNAHLRRR